MERLGILALLGAAVGGVAAAVAFDTVLTVLAGAGIGAIVVVALALVIDVLTLRRLT